MFIARLLCSRHHWQNGQEWEHANSGYGVVNPGEDAGMNIRSGASGVTSVHPTAAQLKGENEYPHGHMLSYAGHY